MKLKDSQTFTNLARAYAAECQARTRYEFVEYGFRYNGYEAIAQIIDKIAYQEFNHARMLYVKIQDAEMKQVDNIDIAAGFPFKEKWELAENLRLIAEDEELEAQAYDEFILVAKEEGFKEIAQLFAQIRDVELIHMSVFKELYNQLTTDTLYKRDKPIKWVCASCGYIHQSEEAWETCPLCQAKQGVVQVVLPPDLLF